ncbi:MAG: 16S rRNA (adenine1518-N6/adenine1519-N6)-dimethyltransferase [Dinoroseobacter sp.]|jgi:16S rRNA (adenine1518-N6/adenine1519-N6)-dimethyltransferase
MKENNTNDLFASPRKSLGQNFLQDPNIIRKIVASLNIKKDDVVMEIGPGRGALTELMLALAGQLHLVEFDRDLARYWRQRAEENSNLLVHECDVLKFDLEEVLAPTERRIKIIGNLPYNISSPVLFHLMPFAARIDSQVVMLQKEVVDRMSANSGNKQYGRLSVMLQYRYQIENLFKVPANAFFPPPKVESAIARLTPKQIIERPVNSLLDFEKIVKQAFSQRRKTLRNTLKGCLSAEQMESVGVSPTNRAEVLSVDNFVDLTNLYTANESALGAL